MTSERPENIDEYLKWLKHKHDVRHLPRLRSHFENVTPKIRQDFERSAYWSDVVSLLLNWDQTYLLKDRYQLFVKETPPEIFAKSFDSFLLKTFRKNILENPLWPDCPLDGWLLPMDWLSRVNDIVRTMFVVKYLDGAEFVADQLKELADKHSLEFRADYEAKDEGYYAVHCYITMEFDIPRLDWDTERVPMQIELQITTQLQEVIRTLLHRFYESRRERPVISTEKQWQWQYGNNEFSVNYLGHILHYLEGMIMDIRNKQRGVDS